MKTFFANLRHEWNQHFSGSKLRHTLFPNSAAVSADKVNWPQAKSMISLLSGAGIGGALGVLAYGLPYMPVACVTLAAPLLALATLEKIVSLPLRKGETKDRINKIAGRTFRLGLLAAFAPVAVFGAAAFVATHAALTLGETALRLATVGVTATVKTAAGTAAPAPERPDGARRSFEQVLRGSFGKSAASPATQPPLTAAPTQDAPAPQPEKPQP